MARSRYTKAYKKAGIDQGMFYYIYGKLMNMKYCHKEFDAFVHKCCEAVALDEWYAVYEFIINPNINHVYIYNKYRIQKNLLYKWKRDVYMMIAEAVRKGNA